MKRFLNSGLFGVAVLCFFLPFFNIKCNNTKIVTATGIELATGTNIAPAAGGGMFDDAVRSSSSTDTKKMFEIPLLLTLLILLAGVIITLVMMKNGHDKKNVQWALYLSGAVLLFMVAEAVSLMVQMRDLNKEPSLSGLLSWHLDIGYWLVVIIAIGAIVYNSMELKKLNSLPPLTDENGFPTAPPGMDI